jgi:hypothetical protein
MFTRNASSIIYGAEHIKEQRFLTFMSLGNPTDFEWILC